MKTTFEHQLRTSDGVWRVINFKWEPCQQAWDVSVAVHPSLYKARRFVRGHAEYCDYQDMITTTYKHGPGHLLWFVHKLREFEQYLDGTLDPDSNKRNIRIQGADNRRVQAYRYLERMGYQQANVSWCKRIRPGEYTAKRPSGSSTKLILR